MILSLYEEIKHMNERVAAFLMYELAGYELCSSNI